MKYPVQHKMLMFWLDQANAISDAACKEFATKVKAPLREFHFFADTFSKFVEDHNESYMIIHFGENRDNDIHVIDSGFHILADNFMLEQHLLNNLFDARQRDAACVNVLEQCRNRLSCNLNSIVKALHMFSSQEELELKMYLSGDEKYTYEGHSPEKWAQLCRETKQRLSSKKSV